MARPVLDTTVQYSTMQYRIPGDQLRLVLAEVLRDPGLDLLVLPQQLALVPRQRSVLLDVLGQTCKRCLTADGDLEAATKAERIKGQC